MSGAGYVGNLRNTEDGTGWSGVTEAEKDAAAGRDPRDATPVDRLLTAAWNGERVALLHGSGHWTGVVTAQDRQQRDEAAQAIWPGRAK